MSIWILAFCVIGATVLAGWRQGGIRAAIAFGGIVFATLLANLVGKIFHPLLPHLGTGGNPILVWALAPVCGFILVTIIFSVIAFNVHRKVDVNYKHKTSELRLALWQRLNTRLGICIGVLNGAIYFVLVSFFVFNIAYWTTQISAGAKQNSIFVRLVNSLGTDLQASGFSRTSAAVGKLQPQFYQFADLAGFLTQNPQTAPRFAEYPALTSLWQRDDMQPLVTDSNVTNALASGATIGELLKEQPVQDFLKNKDLRGRVTGILETNYDDLTVYLKTGKSPKYDGQKILGEWQLNVGVSIAWLRQSNPKITSKEMAAVRTMWTAAYAQTTFLMTADNQIFVKNFPRFETKAQAGQPPFTLENWAGDWSLDGDTYTLHLALNGQDKYLTATTADGLRLSVKDGKTLLVFDHVD